MRSHKFKPKEIIDYAWTRVDYFELRVIKIFTPGEDLDLECGVDRGDLDGGRVDLLPDPLWTFRDLTLYANSTAIKPTLHQVKPSQKKYLILDNYGSQTPENLETLENINGNRIVKGTSLTMKNWKKVIEVTHAMLPILSLN